MKRNPTYFALTILTSLLFFQTASAQRTQSYQSSLRVSSLYNGTSVGAEAFYEMYTLNGYWQAGLQGSQYRGLLSNGNSLEYMHALAQGGYLFRLVGTRSRSLSLYGGAGVQLGVEILDVWHRLPRYMDIDRSRYGFIYGLYGSAVLEWFVAKRFAILLQGQVPVSFGSAMGAVRWNAGIGLKWNL